MTDAPWWPLVIDTFAGPGGWDEGVRPLGLAPRGLELNTDACGTARTAGHYRHQTDVAALNPRDTIGPWGRCRGQLGSPPCPGWSIAGKGGARIDAVSVLPVLARVHSYADLQAALDHLRPRMGHPETLLALEPLRYALALTPSWIAWEQVREVLPLWEACATVLRRIGYSVATGVLRAEQYGVPQTRRRAVLVARAPWMTREHGPARLPEPTHSRFYERQPTFLDDGVKPWVSMADAIGWGMTHRPSMTVTGGGRRTGGAEPFGNGARQSMRRERDAGRWIDRPGVEHRASTIAVPLADAARLQTFPADYPWQGTAGARHGQVGDAVPPLLARAIVSEVAAIPGEDR